MCSVRATRLCVPPPHRTSRAWQTPALENHKRLVELSWGSEGRPWVPETFLRSEMRAPAGGKVGQMVKGALKARGEKPGLAPSSSPLWTSDSTVSSGRPPVPAGMRAMLCYLEGREEEGGSQPSRKGPVSVPRVLLCFISSQ